MKIRIIFLLLFLTGNPVSSQIKHEHLIGINILQLTSTTINATYSFTINPFLALNASIGHTFDYLSAANIDIQSFIFNNPNYCQTGSFNVEKAYGTYYKFGGVLNFRKKYLKKSYFFYGMQFIYARAVQTISWPNYFSEGKIYTVGPFNHLTQVFGIDSQVGYRFRISKRIVTDIGIQLTLPVKNYRSYYECILYIPGIGVSDAETKIIPMINLNLYYKLN